MVVVKLNFKNRIQGGRKCNTVALLPYKGGSLSNSEARVVLERDTISEPIADCASGCLARCICRIARFNKIPKLALFCAYYTALIMLGSHYANQTLSVLCTRSYV